MGPGLSSGDVESVSWPRGARAGGVGVVGISVPTTAPVVIRLHGLGRHENGAEHSESSMVVAPSEEETIVNLAALVKRTVQYTMEPALEVAAAWAAVIETATGEKGRMSLNSG
jgi:hypothetical protein